jgi:GTPase SAR1 family protein
MSMRLILIGCEYVGKTTLIDALHEWGESRGINFHLDDHFTIPDQFFLSPDDQKAMLAIPPTIKERFQRFQIYYHLDVIANHPDVLLAGFHIEEAIYGPRYYYPEHAWPPYQRRIETHLPADTILLLLTASPEVIRQRMVTSPHRYPVVPSEDVDTVSQQFEAEYRASWIERKLRIDTSHLQPDELLPTFLRQVKPLLDTRDLLRWQIVTEG